MCFRLCVVLFFRFPPAPDLRDLEMGFYDTLKNVSTAYWAALGRVLPAG